MKRKCSFNNLRMIIMFAVLIFYNIVIDQVESSRRFDKLDQDSDGLKSHGLASVDVLTLLPAPSLVQPVLRGTGTIRVLVVTSRLPADSPFVVSSAESPSPSGSHNVLAIVICSLLLAGILIGLFWFICAKWDVDSGEVVVQKPRGAVVSVSPAPPLKNGHRGVVSKPATHPPDPLGADAQSIDKSKPSHPPVENENGGSEPTHAEPSIENGGSKPSNAVVVPPVVNENEGDGSVDDQPSAPPIAWRKSKTSRHSSMEPQVKTNVTNAPIELVTRHPIRVIEPVESSAGPLRLAEVGLIVFSYEELRDSTDDFSGANFLGEGGFAKVFKGSLTNGRKVAVKVLRNESSKAEKEFQNEVDIISRARHRNIVSLVGYCITQTKRLIVYEFVENSSLHDHLTGRKNLQVMDWAVRIKIAKGASKGLIYLHEECPQKIIHRDVKPANILLDLSFVPKVADFGISKLCPDHFDSLIATYAIGSVGFIDPVYMETKELSAKSDVYAFGVVLLMLISGQVDLVKVHGLKSELSRALKSSNFRGIADERLNDKYDLDEMTRMVTCAEACVRREPKDRPDMSQISRVLENNCIAHGTENQKTRPG